MGLRVTDNLPDDTAQNVYRAANYARHNLERPLNTFVTIHVGLLAGEGGWRQRRQTLQTDVRRWLERRGERLTLVWVAEAPKRDIHVHLVLHIPTKALRKELEAYLRTHHAADGEPQAIDVRPVNRRPNRRKDRDSFQGVIDYIVKGRNQAQGRIKGKRAGVTQDIGPKARQRDLQAAQAA